MLPISIHSGRERATNKFQRQLTSMDDRLICFHIIKENTEKGNSTNLLAIVLGQNVQNLQLFVYECANMDMTWTQRRTIVNVYMRFAMLFIALSRI